MKLRDLLSRKQKDLFPYDDSMSEDQLVDILQGLRAEEMFENNPKLRAELKQKIADLTKIVALKTKRPSRDIWTDEQRKLRNR